MLLGHIAQAVPLWKIELLPFSIQDNNKNNHWNIPQLTQADRLSRLIIA
jgi:hypothetical protein